MEFHRPNIYAGLKVGQTYELFADKINEDFSKTNILESLEFNIEDLLGCYVLDLPKREDSKVDPEHGYFLEYNCVGDVVISRGVLPMSFEVLDIRHCKFKVCWDDDYPDTALDHFDQYQCCVKLNFR